MRTLCVGDIHGALKALQQVLKRADAENDTNCELIFLGDYVDGWPESAELVQYIMDLKNPKICIAGNHDLWCRGWLEYGEARPIWVSQGGQATIDSYVKTGYLAEQSHRDFFNKLITHFIDGDENVFVHGGFPGRNLDKIQNSEYYCCWDRSLWDERAMIPGSDKKVHDYDGKVFIGHTSTVNWGTTEPMFRRGVWNLDTGAGYRGVLTAMDIHSEEYWQSDPCMDLYPDSPGRNGYRKKSR